MLGDGRQTCLRLQVTNACGFAKASGGLIMLVVRRVGILTLWNTSGFICKISSCSCAVVCFNRISWHITVKSAICHLQEGWLDGNLILEYTEMAHTCLGGPIAG